MPPENTDPFSPWNRYPYKDDPRAPHNCAPDKEDPSKAWNKTIWGFDDLTQEERDFYQLDRPWRKKLKHLLKRTSSQAAGRDAAEG
jgi:hypothetical protein